MTERLFVIRTEAGGYVVEPDSHAVLAWRDRPGLTDPLMRVEAFVPESEVEALSAEVSRLVSGWQDAADEVETLGNHLRYAEEAVDEAKEEIERLKEAVRVRDEAATAGLGTMDFCGYCGQEGPSHPNMLRTDRTHRIPCPTQTHPLNRPEIPDSSEAK
jgi:hypothetical protein